MSKLHAGPTLLHLVWVKEDVREFRSSTHRRGTLFSEKKKYGELFKILCEIKVFFKK